MRRVILAAAIGAFAAGTSVAQTPAGSTDPYFRSGQAELQRRLSVRPIAGQAKNVILFVGDGMGISTITAGRIWTGQSKGVDGESYTLALDALPWGGLVKTYTHDAQVADSAPTATALLAGVKTRNTVIGVDHTVPDGDCEASKRGHVASLIERAEDAGLSTGVVSTARITHATPAATYAHVAERDWENDTELSDVARTGGCPDIARQLVEFSRGDGIDLVFGGGRSQFRPSGAADPEHPDVMGLRGDGRDLIAEWRARHPSGRYLADRAGFDALNARTPTPILGLFSPDHMAYELDRPRDPGGEPSLAEMTRKAIEILSRDGKGFVLLVEGGRIDHANHANNAARALSDLAAFDEAVATAVSMTNPRETLIVVTADHSHGLTISGYPRRGNPILDVVRGQSGTPSLGRDGKPYNTLNYATGPGGRAGERRDPSTEATDEPDYRQPALVQMSSGAHAGEDVAVKAVGPYAHLLAGTIEQHTIFHVMAHALGPRLKARR